MSPPYNPHEPEPTNADIMGLLRPMADTTKRLDRYITGGDEPERGILNQVARLNDRTKNCESVRDDVNDLKSQARTTKWWVRTAIALGLVGGGVAAKSMNDGHIPHP